MLMDIAIWLPVAAAIVGALLYFLAANPKVMEVGRLMYFAGLFVALLHLAGRALRISA